MTFVPESLFADLPEDVAAGFYGDNDTHRMYIGEIVACYQKES